MSISFVFNNLWCFILFGGETYTPPYSVKMPDCFLNNFLFISIHCYLHLNFSTKMIKRYPVRHNRSWMRKMSLSTFLIFICHTTEKNGFGMFWSSCHTWMIDPFDELTLWRIDFYEQWLTDHHSYFARQWLPKF